MAKKDFKDLKSLFAHLQKQVNSTMLDEVADSVRFEEQKQIQKIVYNQYTPFKYSRRGYDDDGLQDLDVMVATLETRGNEVLLSVVNEARGNDQEDLYLAPLIEYGQGSGNGEYDHPYNRDNTAWKFLQSRPFTAATIEALKASKAHVKAMKDGLKSRGLKIE